MDLTDLDSVKAWLGLPTDAGPNDALLSQLITAASAFVAGYLNRSLLSASYAETYDGTGTRMLMLRRGAITAVQSVSFCGRTLTTAADPVAGAPGILFDGRRVSLIGDPLPPWRAGGRELHRRLRHHARRRRPGDDRAWSARPSAAATASVSAPRPWADRKPSPSRSRT